MFDHYTIEKIAYFKIDEDRAIAARVHLADKVVQAQRKSGQTFGRFSLSGVLRMLSLKPA